MVTSAEALHSKTLTFVDFTLINSLITQNLNFLFFDSFKLISNYSD